MIIYSAKLRLLVGAASRASSRHHPERSVTLPAETLNTKKE